MKELIRGHTYLQFQYIHMYIVNYSKCTYDDKHAIYIGKHVHASFHIYVIVQMPTEMTNDIKLQMYIVSSPF